MIRYMLDTNTIVYATKRNPACVLKKLLSLDPPEICISAIIMAELEYGVSHSSRPDQNRSAMLLFLSHITVLPFDADAAFEYGMIRHHLQSQGMVIGGNDMLIAAHAKAENLVLVTHNTREFSRVSGLRLDDWAMG